MSENRERSNMTWGVGCLSAAAVIIAAIIGLGVPFAERLADVYFPTMTPNPINPPSFTSIPNSPTQIPPTQTIVPINPVQRPPRIHVVNGQGVSFPSTSEDWIWICTGDFSIILPDGNRKALYDVGISNTGLVLVIPANSRFTLDGPFDMPQGAQVGDCYPYSQAEKDSGLAGAIKAQLEMGCGSSCQYVNVITLDKNGTEINNYWTPQQP